MTNAEIVAVALSGLALAFAVVAWLRAEGAGDDVVLHKAFDFHSKPELSTWSRSASLDAWYRETSRGRVGPR